MHTCIYVYFVHLFFNSDLPSIQLIQSGYRRISSSIFPRWDFFSIGTQKEKIQHVVIEMIFVRALLRATHVSSAVRCYEPSWSESWNDRFCWHVWHFFQKHCTLCLCKRHGASNRTERQTCCKFARISICKSTERDSCCKFACISSCKSTERQTCCKFACISICKSTERRTCCCWWNHSQKEVWREQPIYLIQLVVERESGRLISATAHVLASRGELCDSQRFHELGGKWVFHMRQLLAVCIGSQKQNWYVFMYA